MSTSEDKDLGLDIRIDRRDFCGMMLAGAGTAFMPGIGRADDVKLDDALGWTMSAEEFDGFGGQGDYGGSNGNTWRVVNSAHRIRDGVFRADRAIDVQPTGETYDLVVVGGGPSGMGSAYHFHKQARKGSTCLILENHSIFGGLAKRNEMCVGGTRLMAPQGSNVFVSTGEERERMISPTILQDIGLSTDAFEYASLTGAETAHEFDRTNFVYYYPPANSDSVGFFFESDGGYELTRNPWANGFDGAPISDSLKNELMRWRFDTEIPQGHDDPERWLDSMTFQQYLQDTHGFSDELCRIVNRFIGGGKAFNGEICSAYAMSFNRYPGLVKRPFYSLDEYYRRTDSGPVRVDGFPGGNALTSRYFAKYLIPDLIPGSTSPDDVINNTVDTAALDREGQGTRLRGDATVVSVKHNGSPDSAESVDVIYEMGGRLFKVRARSVVMATGAWVNKHVLEDAPAHLRAALGGIRHAPTLVANVALNNWRFLEKAGITACLWDGGDFGFQCNLRRPVSVGDYRPPLQPDKPIFLTFYAPFIYPGQPAAAQTARGRNELFTTPFREFERRIRRQMTRMFAPYGFEAARDIAGIITNRWGHAYVVPEPGFYFGINGEVAARDIIRAGYGKVAFAHSELYGFQSYETAVLQSEQAIGRILA